MSTIISVTLPASLADHVRELATAITTADAARDRATRAADDGPPDDRAANLVEAAWQQRQRDECARELGIHLAALVAAA